MSRVVVIDDCIIWAVGETPQVQGDPGSKTDGKTTDWEGQGGQESGTWSSL